jgi:hypothetical protein
MTQANEPAFPASKCSGLSKREYFAGLALQASIMQAYSNDVTDAVIITNDAVRLADALLSALAPEEKT